MTAPHLGPGHAVAGKYTIRALLGFTGEVATYHAVSNDGREVVIKLHDPGIGQRADVMGELERVRRLVANLPPGGVIPILDAGYDVGTGAPFSATEYQQTPSLAKLVETGPLSPDVVAMVLRALSTVLESAHAVGLAHLALKPTNLFVGPAPTYAVRVSDFDAQVIRRTSPATHEVYAQCAPWWAPEQLQPAAVLGPAADVFTTALIAFYALTAHSYWFSCQRHPADLPNWQLELMGARQPVSKRSRELGSVINPLFDGVFGRALSVNQSDRPQSPMEIANVLAAASGADQINKTLAFADGFAGMDFTPPPAFGAGTSDQGGYVATGGGPPPQPQPDGAMTAAGLPPFPQPVKRKTSSSVLPIVIGVAAAVLLGGGGVAFLFMRSPSDTQASSAPDGDASSSASAATGDTEPAPKATPPTAPADPAPSPSTTPSAVPSAEPELVSVVVRCVPSCDRIEVDGKPLDKPDQKLELPPGKHKLRLVKSGYLIQEDDILVEAGKAIDKEYRLIKLGPVKPRNNCGQFLCP